MGNPGQRRGKIFLDLQTQDFGPYLKPGDTPVNHPPKVLENIPKGINRRLSSISATKEIFDKAVPVYQSALEHRLDIHTYLILRTFQTKVIQLKQTNIQKHTKGP